MTLAAYRSVRLVGGILPADVLTRAADLGMAGQAPDDYELTPGVTVTAAVARAWNDLLGAWQQRQRRLTLAPGETANRITRDRWLMPLLGQLGYGRVPALPAGVNLPPGLGETTPRHYTISHQIGWPLTDPHPTAAVVVHLVADTTDLDKRTGGVAARAPHGMVQEFLNHSDRHLYAILASGRTVRLLRDASSLTKQSYVEFDLDTMFGEQLFADFRLMWLLLHATRLAPEVSDESAAEESLEAVPTDDAAKDDDAEVLPVVPVGPRPDDCWLERWRRQAISEGTRARDALEAGVAAAITALGTGFVSHSANNRLREALRTAPELDQDLRRWLLRCVYRFIVLFVAEDRELLHPLDPQVDDRIARELYLGYFSTARLRRFAASHTGSRHCDLWAAHMVITDALGSQGSKELALPALSESLYGRARIGLLAGARISNRYLLAAVRHLSQVKDRRTGQSVPVDYRNLDSEELGGVYEGLLAYVPRYDPTARTFTLVKAAGSERKKSGSYYTPTELIALVLDESLDPLIAAALASSDPEQALLTLTVCDPACGSGHFLVAAARRIAGALAVHRETDPEPSPPALRSAIGDVVAKCIYGVDINDLAVEVAKVALWLEALSPGKPFAFLDHHLKVGNALLGTTPKLLTDGIPDTAYAVLDGDDKDLTKKVKARNKYERGSAELEAKGEVGMFDLSTLHWPTTDIAYRALEIEAQDAASLDDVRELGDAWRKLDKDPDLENARLVHDAWCAAFFQAKSADNAPSITHSTLAALRTAGQTLEATESAVRQAAREHRFFHWHLEFPTIFSVPEDGYGRSDAATGWSGGFSCVLGNPPWERVKIQDKEWFSAVGRDDIANAGKAAKRRKAIEGLAEHDPALLTAYLTAQRRASATAHFLLNSGRFPLTGRGDVNTYSVFTETFRTFIDPRGCAGIVTPTGIATDKTTSVFFGDLVQTKTLAALHDFVTNPRIWTDVGNRKFRFAVSAIRGRNAPVERIRMSFFSRHPSEVTAERIFTITPEEINLLNPNTGNCPLFITRRDADLTLGAYRRHPVLLRDGKPPENPWKVSFLRMFDMANDSGLFAERREIDATSDDGWLITTAKGDKLVPLYEAKLLWHYNHRLSSYALRAPGSRDTELPRLSDAVHDDPEAEAVPLYWIDSRHVGARLDGRWDRDWLLGWRDVTGPALMRTLIPCVFPKAGVGHKFPLVLPADPSLGYLLHATWSSLACDYTIRQKMSGVGLGQFVLKQMAVPRPEEFTRPAPWSPARTLADWIKPYVLELSYTSRRLQPYAAELGDFGRPFRWLPERRAVLQAELDGAFMHVYGFDRDAVVHIMSTFRTLANAESKAHGEFRTQRLVLDAYDGLASATRRGGNGWSSAVQPGPGQGHRHP